MNIHTYIYTYYNVEHVNNSMISVFKINTYFFIN